MGSLELIIGPMYAGKTNKIIEIYNELINTTNVLVIDYIEENIIETGKITSHDNLKIDCLKTNKLENIKLHLKEKYDDYKHIIVNEAQFFQNLKDWVLNILEIENNNITLCGLDADFNRSKFGEIWDLIPHADSVIKLKGKCNYCDNKSLYSHRINNKLSQQVILDCTLYLPLCRLCYLKYN